jgi:hypothetical protein
MGKNGPFSDKKHFNLHNVSELSPQWWHNGHSHDSRTFKTKAKGDMKSLPAHQS